MTNLLNYLISVSNSEIAHSEAKIEQKASRAMKEQVTALLCDALASALANESIQIMRTSNGIGISLDNENVGFIPLEIAVTVKNLDYDIPFESEQYQAHLDEMKAKAEEKAKIKAAKIAKDKALREEKARLKKMAQGE